MGVYITIAAVSAAIFLAIVLSLAVKPAIISRISGVIIIITVIGGSVLYGYGYSCLVDNMLLAVMRTVRAVCCMFVGINDLSSIDSAPWFGSEWVLLLFWFLHVCAIYTTANAAITTLGAGALKRIRLALTRRGELVLIYGTSNGALDFGRECARDKGISVLFVSAHPDSGEETAIMGMGAALRSDTSALEPDPRFIKSLRLSNRKMDVYCLDQDKTANFIYATELKKALQDADVDPRKVSLVIKNDDESVASALQAYKGEYGYGNVSVFKASDQAARLAIRKCPLWENIDFDENGRATENFEALIIGFGVYGQSFLKYMIMNGQFSGSHFKVTIVSRGCKDVSGYIKYECPDMFEHYDIEMLDADARSPEVYEFIKKNRYKLKYIAVSIGNEKDSFEISGELRRFIKKLGVQIPVVQCSANGICRKKKGLPEIEKSSVYSKATLDYRISDRYAMALNYRYASDGIKSMWDCWMECDHFSRMSSRASADFMPAMIKMMHTDAESVKKHERIVVSEKTDIENGIISAELAENLGKTEHERWCAFHYAMGFSPMRTPEWRRRAEIYEKEKKESGAGKIRIGKDMETKRHACLVPWDDLDELSDRENRLTGKNIDYKQLDIDNVLEIPAVLKNSKLREDR